MKTSKATKAAFWSATGVFALWMLFTAYAQLALPQVHAAFQHLGIPDYLRIEMSLAKIVGIPILLLPAPSRLKEWAYAGFTIDLGSATIAHLAVRDGASQYAWPIAAGVVMALSYYFYRKLASTSAAR